MMGRRSGSKAGRWVALAAILLWAVACLAFFQGWYHYHFFYQEQNQLFLWSAEYLRTYFSKPAWAACMAGDFLTQFYYYLYAGPAILTLSLLILGDLVRRALQVAGARRLAFPLAIVAMTVFAWFSLGYSYRLSSVMAAIGGTASYLVVSSTLRLLWSRLKLLRVFLYVLIVFWLFGNGVFLHIFFLILSSLTGRQWRQLAWRAAVMLVALGLLAAAKGMYLLNYGKLLAYPGLGKFQSPSFYLEREFAVADEYCFGNYDKVVRMVEAEKRPTAEQKFFYNLVMAQRGKLPEVLLKWPDNYLGTFESLGPATPLLTIKNINELYWTLGDMTFAERAAMLANVFSPGNRNIRMVRRLAEINIVTQDTLAARKYLRLLEKTFVWRKWAREAPGRAEYAEKRRLSNHKDTLRVGDNAHQIMMELVDSNPRNTVALDYMLCSDLLLKDVRSFKRDYDRYCMADNAHAAALYQQALCIWLATEQAPEEEWKRYVNRQDVLQQFALYNRQRGSDAFRGTYWYYYDRGKAPKIQ